MAVENEIDATPKGFVSAVDEGSGSVPLRVLISRNSHGAHVLLLGELDMASAPLFQEKLGDLIAESPGDVALDLASLDFLDSSGLAAILALHEELRARQSTLIIRSPKPSACRIFEITGLTDVLRIELDS
jgi:anti-sigma B factor antagonist